MSKSKNSFPAVNYFIISNDDQTLRELGTLKNNSSIINLDKYNMIGFGAGIDGGRHYAQMINYVEKLPNVRNKKAFIFSTSAIYSEKIMLRNHKVLSDLLRTKGFPVTHEFGCKGFTTRSIFNLIGGKNKGRPNEEDINNAKLFADKLLCCIIDCFLGKVESNIAWSRLQTGGIAREIGDSPQRTQRI